MQLLLFQIILYKLSWILIDRAVGPKQIIICVFVGEKCLCVGIYSGFMMETKIKYTTL